MNKIIKEIKEFFNFVVTDYFSKPYGYIVTILLVIVFYLLYEFIILNP